MEAPISASVGAMGSLLGKLDEILATENKDEILATENKDEIWKLRKHLELTRTLLLNLSKVRDPPITARYWMKDVRELSYDMEDCVDAETNWIDEKMSGFKTRVEEANERYLSYKLGDSVPICADIAIDYRLPTEDGRKAVVGLHAKGGPIDRLCQSLNDQDAKLKVVSIVGVGGIGKTTLAEQLWHKLGRAFQCRAFVQTCKKPDMRSILRSILSQVRPHQAPGVSDVHKLTQDIHEHLQDKSYFVIIDDLWATSVWEVLSRSFPEGNHGSRIITTTEAEDVALACCAYQPTYIFEMQPLSVQHSEELFTSALFGSRVKELDECSHEIMRRCGGLPQAIVSIASILASNRGIETVENTGEQWNYLQNFVLNDLGADIPFEEILKQVLNLCYNSLSSCLQTCLLYLSLYSENYIIFKEDLTKQWIVEGFICASTKKQSMEVARSYFDKLVNMGLIRHIDVKNGDEVLSYAVHHMVHDFITFKSIEVNFITVMDYSQSTIRLSDKVRRLSLQFGSAAYANTPASTRLSQVRSLSFIGLVKCMPCISEFKLLRVLILNLWGDQGSTFDLTRISELFLLRYLQIICNVIVQLPDQMQGLEHMETLEINARPDWSLSHLRLGGETNQPNATLYPSASSSEPCYPFDPVKTFELLPPICSLPKWIGQLNKLCTLKIVVRELLKDDISCLGGLPILTILSLYVRQHTAEIIVFNTAQFAALEYFEFRCGVLSLAFQEGAMPNLQMLKLGFNVHKGEQYGHFLAGIEHLSSLKEVAGVIGVADGAEEPDWRAAESAFKDAFQLASEVSVKRADWIEEEYSSPKNQHFIQEKHPPSEQTGNIKEESDKDIKQNSDTKQKESISRNEDERESTSRRSMAPKRRLAVVDGDGDGDGGASRGKCLRVAGSEPSSLGRGRLRRIVFAILFIIRVGGGEGRASRGKCLSVAGSEPSSLGRRRLRRIVFAILFIIRINEDERESTSRRSMAPKRRLAVVDGDGDGDGGASRGKCLRVASSEPSSLGRGRLRRIVFAILFIIRVGGGEGRASRGKWLSVAGSEPSSLGRLRLRRIVFAILFTIRINEVWRDRRFFIRWMAMVDGDLRAAGSEPSSLGRRRLRRIVFAILFIIRVGGGEGRASRGKCLSVAGIEPSSLGRRRLRRIVFAILFIIRMRGCTSYEPYNISQIRRVVREEVRRGFEPLYKFYSLMYSKLESLEERFQDITYKDQVTSSQLTLDSHQRLLKREI